MRPEAQSVLLETANRYGAEVHYAGVAAGTGSDGPIWPENRATTHKALEVLNATPFGRDWEVPPLEAITKSGHAGRWQWLRPAPSGARILLDCAHNMDGLRRTLGAIEAIECDHLRVVFGAVNDKDVNGALTAMPNAGTYYLCQAHIPRAMPSSELMECALDAGLNGQAYATVEAALEAALADAQPNDLVAVFGSIFIAGEVLVWERSRS